MTAKGCTPSLRLGNCPEATGNPAEGTREIHQSLSHQGPVNVNSNRDLFQIRPGRPLIPQLPQLSVTHALSAQPSHWKLEHLSVGLSSVPCQEGPAPSTQVPQNLPASGSLAWQGTDSTQTRGLLSSHDNALSPSGWTWAPSLSRPPSRSHHSFTACCYEGGWDPPPFQATMPPSCILAGQLFSHSS